VAEIQNHRLKPVPPNHGFFVRSAGSKAGGSQEWLPHKTI